MSLLPTLVFVPGAWHRPIIFDDVRAGLQQHGYETLAVPLATAGSDPPVKDGLADVARIRETVCQLVEEDKDVMIVAHSYGALPSSMACKGISKGERGTQQKRGGVVGLVIIAAPILPLGQSVQSIHLKGRLEEPPWLQVTPDGKYIILDPIERFYNDLPHDVAQHWATQVTHQSESYRTLTLDYDAWNHVPTTYVFCKQDNIAPIRDEATLRELIKNPSIEHVDSGHAPFLSKPRETLNIIRRAAGEKDIGASL